MGCSLLTKSLLGSEKGVMGSKQRDRSRQQSVPGKRGGEVALSRTGKQKTSQGSCKFLKRNPRATVTLLGARVFSCSCHSPDPHQACSGPFHSGTWANSAPVFAQHKFGVRKESKLSRSQIGTQRLFCILPCPPNRTLTAVGSSF